ncbi:MAG: PKD domain-containing protein, partial [Limisphaerales bacterium]
MKLPGIAITPNPTLGAVPLMVSFTAAGVDGGGRTVSNWNWDFGDGITSSAQNPSHTYSASGNFSVALVETDGSGFPIAGSATSITVSPFEVAFSANPASGFAPLTVSFTSADVDSGGNTITKWNWDFGDGSIGSAQSPSHTYSTSGTFPVTLIGTNNLGYAVFGSGPASILALPPPQDVFTFTTNNRAVTITAYSGASDAVIIPGFIYGLPVTAIAGDAIANLFYRPITLTIPCNVTNIGSYAFQNDYYLSGVYFEGNAPSVGSFVFYADSEAVAHYLPGTTGWNASIGAGVPAVELPGITVSANPASGLAPLTVSFTSAALDSGGHTVTNWNWDFGDGATSTAQNPSHTYSASGTFSATLTEATNGLPIAGAAVSITASSLTVALTANPTSGLEPLTVSFAADGVDSGGHSITNWNWDFGDGSTSTAQNPSHTYSTSGTFSAVLTAVNNVGLLAAGSGPSITVSPLTVAFGADPITGLAPLTVSLTAAGVDSGGHTITNWNLDFGDGSTSTAQNPSHTYSINGSFSLVLTATNNLGLMVAGLGPASLSALLP